jgi:hypothetical protein
MVAESVGKRGIAFLSLFSVLLVAGCCCAGSVKMQEEAGAVNVTVTLVAPWEEYIESLTPNFGLDAEEALKKVVPRTAIVEGKASDVLGFSARAGFPQTSESSIKTLKQTGDQITTTEERVEKKEPGKLPELGTRGPESERGMKDLPGIPESEKKLSNDPLLEYTAATALYQEVQLLSRYVTDAALRHKMRAYIVRLQIGIIPFRRNLNYDVYTKIGFFPKEVPNPPRSIFLQAAPSQSVTHPAFVLPLLVTDNLEGALVSQTYDTIRQLALAISFMKGGVGANVGLDNIHEQFQSSMFADVNSLFTVGRLSDNALSVRFGAVHHGKDKKNKSLYSMIPRTHNVTLVIMVPEGFAEPDISKKKEIRVVTRTLMRSTDNGSILPQERREERFKYVEDAVERLLSSDDEAQKMAIMERVRGRNCISRDEEDIHNGFFALILCSDALLREVWKNDFAGYEEALKDAGLKERIGRYPRDLWMDIVESLDRHYLSGARFQLPNSPRLTLPPTAPTVLLVDDGKTHMQATLTGGAGLISTRMSAVLHVTLENNDELALPGSGITAMGGTNPILTFASPSSWSIGKLKTKSTGLLEAKLKLTHSAGRWDTHATAAAEETYENIAYRKVAEVLKPVFAIRKAVDLIKPDANTHEGALKISVEFEKDARRQGIPQKVEITVEGAEIVSVQFAETNLPQPRWQLGKIIVEHEGTLDLKLRNLDKSRKVVLKGSAKDQNNTVVGGNHGDVTFDVVN